MNEYTTFMRSIRCRKPQTLQSSLFYLYAISMLSVALSNLLKFKNVILEVKWPNEFKKINESFLESQQDPEILKKLFLRHLT
jgi:hypothetical protein